MAAQKKPALLDKTGFTKINPCVKTIGAVAVLGLP
jgi:hypothetical protein